MASTPNPSFLAAIKVFGGQTAMARAIAKPVQLINQIKKGERPMPDGWAPTIEEKTAELGEVVHCEELAPSVNWSYLRATKQSAPTSTTQEVTHG